MMAVRMRKARNAIIEAVVEAWKSLEPEFFFHLTGSITRRVQIVVKAMGGYTGY
jgi:hypothetical protein